MLGALLAVPPAQATLRSFAYTHESPVLGAGESELTPWTTFRAGRSRYYSALDGRLELAHGFARDLELSLFWNFRSETRDVELDSLTRKLSRVSSSELASASMALKYAFTDSSADALGSALRFEATLGPNRSELAARAILDRAAGAWRVAGNLAAQLELHPLRTIEGSELKTTLVLEPTLAGAYALGQSASFGLELRAPLAVAGERSASALFGGPVLRWADRSYWAALGVMPQLAAFSGRSQGSRLALGEHERLEVRLLAGFLL
jgi:hypothetical protein